MFKKKFILIWLALAFSGVVVQSSYGKEYPTKPVEIVCSLPPGSSMDLVSRMAADLVQKHLGQRVFVNNKMGAGGTLSAADVIGSKPDGYKVLVTFNSLFATGVKTQKVPFDPNDLVPLLSFMQFKLGMFVKGDSQWKTFNDLLEFGRKNPGTLRWTHTGRGLTEHINALLIFRKAGIEVIDVPSKGGPEKMFAVLGGHVDVSCGAYGNDKEQVQAGKIRYLIFFNDRRYSDPSDVPSAKELGFPEATKLSVIISLYVHKDTPEEIKQTLSRAFKKVCEEPEFEKRIKEIGEEPKFMGPDFINEATRRLEEASVPILKELGLYVGK